MNQLTATERGDLAERMLPIAAQLACITHGDGNEQDIRYVLGQLDQLEIRALVVVLAGLINPDTELADALGYITWDEEGRATTPPDLAGTLRQIARIQWTPLVLPEDQQAMALEMHALGFNGVQIAERVGMKVHNVRRFIKKCEAAA